MTGEGSNSLFIFGATGFVGRHLLAGLAGRGWQAECFVRDERGAGKVSGLGCRPAKGDLLKPETYRAAIKPGAIVIYLIRMGEPRSYAEDQRAAAIAARACREAGASRLIHLTGLLDPAERLSPYFETRRRVAEALEASGPPATILRASLIFGSGSIAYELFKTAVERLAIIPLPPWRETRVQPIAVSDVTRCLVAALGRPDLAGRTLDIGGPATFTYGELIRRFAQARGLRRRFIEIPMNAHLPASLLLSLLSGCGAGEIHALLRSLKNVSVVPGENAMHAVFGLKPAPVL